jgi:NADH-quinone oxidoreductase subunit H
MLVAGVWRFMPSGVLRWIVCIAIIAIPSYFLSLALKRKKKFQTRIYQFAD